MKEKYKPIYEDNMLLAVDKPAGLLSQGDRTGGENLLDILKLYLKKQHKKPGNVYLGLVHRLDRNTSGIICFAKNSKSASRLSAQFRENHVQRVYNVVVHGIPKFSTGILRDKLLKDTGANIVTTAEDGKESGLEYKILKTFKNASLLEITLLSGRPHQIRVQLQNAGFPVMGDLKYGHETLLIKRPAVHALSLTLTHPVSKKILILKADWPGDFKKLISSLTLHAP